MACFDWTAYPGAQWRPVDDDDKRDSSYDEHVTGYVHCDVTIRRVSDGIERVHVDTTGFEVCDNDPQTAIDLMRYWWLDGNGSCDCNKRLFFDRAGGIIEDYDDGIGCTSEEYEITAPAWLARGIPSTLDAPPQASTEAPTS